MVNSEQGQSTVIASVSHTASASSKIATGAAGRLSATSILIIINVLVFWAMLGYAAYLNGVGALLDSPVGAWFDPEQLRRWGSNYGPYTLGGQYWRIITSLFLHLDIFHLAWNMVFLWALGRQLDLILGRTRTLAVYLLTGIGGSLLSLCWHPTLNRIGASGAVLGLAGVLISLLGFGGFDFPRRKIIGAMACAVFSTLFALTAGLHNEDIDNAGHIGGLVSGLVIGALFAWTLRTNPVRRLPRQRKALSLAAAVLVVLFAILIGARGDVVELYRGERALERNDPGAIAHIQKFVTHNPGDVTGHLELGNAYYQLKEYANSATEFRRALEIQPGSAGAQHNLAMVYTYYLNRPDEAVPLFRESLQRLAQNGDNYFDFGNALRKAGKLQEAEKMAQKAIALGPKSARNHQLLATILDELGKPDEAASEYKLAEQLRVPKSL